MLLELNIRRRTMAKMSMQEIKELIRKQNENKGEGNSFKNSDIYPFWKMKAGETAIVRFLPDANEKNPLAFVVKDEHKLSLNGETRKIPCPKMYGHNCPICDKSQEYYKAEGKKSQNGKYYWRDRMHLARALVLSDPLPPDPETGENFEGKVVTLQLGFQVHQKIESQIDEFFEIDDPVPWGFDAEDDYIGYNFKIKSTSQGEHNKYDLASTFEKNSSNVDKKYVNEIELVDLTTLLPEEVTYDQANEFLDNHLSGGMDDDSLQSKKRSTSGSDSDSGADSKRNSMLSRLGGDDLEEADDDDFDELKETVNKAKAEEAEAEEEEAPSTSDDDDDDDDDDDLQAIIARTKRNKK